jgi:hypothetical protein
MSGLMILFAVLAAPYVALNVRRVMRGRRWAFTFCQAAREWEEHEQSERVAAQTTRAEVDAPRQ